jgi:histidyl-tRNA synthetase
MKNFGAKSSDFSIRINDRKIINAIFAKFTEDARIIYEVSKLIDKKKQIPAEVFEAETKFLLGDETGEISTTSCTFAFSDIKYDIKGDGLQYSDIKHFINNM